MPSASESFVYIGPLIGFEQVRSQLENLRAWAQGDAAVAGAENSVARINARLADRVIDEIGNTIKESYPPASAPGEPPHWRTGTLFRALQHGRLEDAPVQFADTGDRTLYAVWIDEAKAPYGKYLEYGWGEGTKAARPFFWPGAFRATAYAQEHWKVAIEGVLRKIFAAGQTAGARGAGI